MAKQEQEQNKTIQQDDEIDLYELWDVLKKQKNLIIGVTTMAFILAAVYAFSIKPIYQSKAFFTPVDQVSVQKLSDWDALLGRNNTNISDSLFRKFQQKLYSRSNLWEFFNTKKLYQVYDSTLTSSAFNEASKKKKVQKAFAKFYKSFSVMLPSKKENFNYFSVSLSLPMNEADVQVLLSDYIDLANQKTRIEIFNAIQVERQSLIRQLELKINSMRAVASDVRSDRISELGEAITIAHNLQLEEPPKIGAKASIQGVSNQGLPLYYLGYRLLEAEKRVLQERKSDDPFIKGLRGLQEKRSLYDAFKLAENDIFAVQIDLPPTLGEKIKPEKSLIIVVGVLLGGILGIFIALMRGGIEKRRKVVNTEVKTH